MSGPRQANLSKMYEPQAVGRSGLVLLLEPVRRLSSHKVVYFGLWQVFRATLRQWASRGPRVQLRSWRSKHTKDPRGEMRSLIHSCVRPILGRLGISSILFDYIDLGLLNVQGRKYSTGASASTRAFRPGYCLAASGAVFYPARPSYRACVYSAGNT